MLEHFEAAFAGRRDNVEAGEGWVHPRLDVVGYAAFAQKHAGASFGGGLYRVHDSVTGPQAFAFVSDAFPEFAERVCPFGYDWLGRQFAVDSGRIENGQPQVLVLEPGAGAALEIPVDFVAFHDEELVEQSDAALASGFFGAWSEANPDALPLLRSQCVGYKVPLFLGGNDTVDNLEVSDLDVYWTIFGQLRGQVT
jgi:hypothetical protein